MDNDQAELRRQLAELLAERRAADPAYSLARFGEDLGRLAGRKTAYAKGYVANVLKGVAGFPVSAELGDALERLAAVADGASEFQAKLHVLPADALALHALPPGVIIMGQARACAGGCGRSFVGAANRRYCPKCRPPRKHTERT